MEKYYSKILSNKTYTHYNLLLYEFIKFRWDKYD